MSGRPRVVTRKVAANVGPAVRATMEAAGVRDTVGSGSTVFVKPNYAIAIPRPGVTTNPEVLEAVLGTLKDRASRVLVGESDGGTGSFLAEEALKNHALADICKRTGAEMVNLSEEPPVVVEEEVLGRRVSVHLPRAIYGKVDVSVTVPVMKTHVITTASMGLKNLWGCDTDGYRFRRRKFLSRRLALIADKLKVRFSVVDALVGLDGFGPIEGTPVPLGYVLAGNNIVATDACGMRLMGIDPRSIAHVRLASEAGLGPIAADAIDFEHVGQTPLHRFRATPRLREYLIRASFHSPAVTRVVYDSSLTPYVYALFGKRPKPRHPRRHDV